MRLFRRAAAATLPLVFAGLLAGTSGAFTIPVHSCTTGIPMASGEERWSAYDTPEIALQDDCPSGLVATPSAFVSPNQLAQWKLEDGRSLQMTAISFKFSGFGAGSDLDVGFAVANGGPVVRAEDFPAPDLDGRIRIEFPDGVAYAPTFFVGCTAPAGCIGADPITFSDFTFEVTDSEPPSVGGSVEGHTLSQSGFSFWTSENWIESSIDFLDFGLGVYTGDVKLTDPDGATESLWNGFATCRTEGLETLPTAAVCPTSLSAPNVFDLRLRPGGIYELSASASDALGQQTEAHGFEFGIDREAPDAPTGVRAVGAFPLTNWTSAFDVGIQWDAPPTQGEGAAPLATTRWRLRRPGGAAADYGEVSASSTSQSVNVPAEGMWEFETRFSDEAGNVGDRSYASFGVDDDAPNAPELDPPGWVSRDSLIDGHSIEWTPAAVPGDVESGVCGFAVSVDDDPFGSPPARIDEPAASTTHRLAPAAAGLHFAHLRSVSCAGVGSTVDTKALNVDSEGPKIAVAGLPASGWSRTGLDLSIGATDADGAGHPGSGVGSISYSLDGAPPVGIGNGDSLHVGDGNHRLVVNAVDSVGNPADPSTFAFAIDNTRPEVSILARDAAAPQRVDVDATDSGSGIAAAVLEYFADGAWRAAAPRSIPAPVGIGSLRASFVIPDASIPAGAYDFRVVVSDVAGNERTVDMPGIRLPLRTAVHLTARIADVAMRCRTSAGKRCKSLKKCPRRTRCRLTPVTLTAGAGQSVVRAYGSDTAIVVDAVSEDGLPLPGATLDVASTELLSASSSHRSATTDRDGRAELMLPRGAGREIAVTWNGDATRLPARSVAHLSVRTGISLSVNSRRPRGGSTTRFRGKVMGTAGRIPAGGLAVVFEFKTPRGWETFGKAVAVDDRGNFQYSRDWPRSGKRSALQIRAYVRSDETVWPYASGGSHPITLHLRP